MSNSMFGDAVTTDASIEGEKDILGGGGSFLHATDVYDATITAAYKGLSTGGAHNVTFHFDLGENRTHRETFYVTSGTAKGGKNYYEKDGQRHFQPGYLMVNAICLFGLQRELVQLTTADVETKQIELFNKEAGKAVPTPVEMIMPLIGAKVQLGLMQVKADKNEKNAAGNYVATGDAREFNEIKKIFHPTKGLTTEECRNQITTPEFRTKWLEKWKDQVEDFKFKGVRDPSLGNAPAGGAAQAGNVQGAGTPVGTATPSLFS